MRNVEEGVQLLLTRISWKVWFGHPTRPTNVPALEIHPPRVTEHGTPITNHQPRVTSHSAIPQSAGFGRKAIRGRSIARRSGIPCAPPSPEFLRLGIYASFPSRWSRLRPT